MPDDGALVRDATIASEITNMVCSTTDDAVKVSVSQEKDGGSRVAFCRVECEKVALRVCRKLCGQTDLRQRF